MCLFGVCIVFVCEVDCTVEIESLFFIVVGGVAACSFFSGHCLVVQAWLFS